MSLCTPPPSRPPVCAACRKVSASLSIRSRTPKAPRPSILRSSEYARERQPAFGCRSRAYSDDLKIDGLGAFGVRLRIERDALTFRQAAHTGGLDGGGVHKDILAAAFRRHKAKALIRIEEFHCS